MESENKAVSVLIKAYSGVEILLCSFLSLALDGDEWSAACLSHFMPFERTPVSIDGGSVNPKSWFGCYGEKKTTVPLVSSL
jgi:hypothetical protein